MLYPSIDSLLTKIDSKYSLVTVAAKRARNMQDLDLEYIAKTKEEGLFLNYDSHKYVGKALEEIQEGKLQLKLAD